MYTLKNLISLLGLKGSDPKVKQWFKTQDIGKPIQLLARNQWKRHVNDKRRGLQYWFEYEVANDLFYPSVISAEDPAKFETILHGIIVYDERNHNGRAALPLLPESFWEGNINPNSNLEEVVAFFDGKRTTESVDDDYYFVKSLGELAKIQAWFSPKKQKITMIRISIQEANEIFSYADFADDNVSIATKHAYTLLVKWLFDNQYLAIPKRVYSTITLSNGHKDLVLFVKEYLKSHIWDTQLVSILGLEEYLHQIRIGYAIEDEGGERFDMYIRDFFYKALTSKREKNKGEIIELNDDEVARFFELLTENFSLFSEMRGLKYEQQHRY